MLAIVCLAFALRVVNLTEVPPGFFCDEATCGLDASALGRTLRDREGNFLPVYIKGLGQWRAALYTYWLVPFVALFGLNEFAVRLGSVALGTITVWLTYLFVSKAANRPIGLISALLLATSPWHILQSRAGWGIVDLPCVTALCLVCLYRGLERPRWLPLAFAIGALGMYTYFPGRLFFPLFCIAILVIYAGPLRQQRRASLVGLAVACILLIPTILAFFRGIMFTRMNELSQPLGLAQRVSAFATNYLAHFSPEFLVQPPTREPILRHYVQGYGMLYEFELPFLIIGVIVMLVRRHRFDLLCLAWFVVYPVAAIVSPPLSTRSITGVLVFQIAVAQGIYTAVMAAGWIAERVAALRPYRQGAVTAAAVLILITGQQAATGFVKHYFTAYRSYAAGWWGWQYGAKQIVSTFMAHRGEYDRLLMDSTFNGAEELVTFYTWPDRNRCPNCSVTIIPQDANNYPEYRPQEQTLWAVAPYRFPNTFLAHVPYRAVGEVTYPDGSIAFLFVETGPGIKTVEPLPTLPPMPALPPVDNAKSR